MHPQSQAEAHAAASWKVWRRQRRRARKTVRWFDTVAAVIPSVIMLTHLALRSSAAVPENNDATPGKLARPVTETVAVAAVVPEPSALALVAFGTGALMIQRRRGKAQPSSTATAVA